MTIAPYQLKSSQGVAYSIGQDGLRIGRAPTNDIIVNEPRVSRTHARLLFAGGRYWIRDEESRQGVLVNGLPVQGQQEFRVGDTLQVGTVTFRLISASSYNPVQKPVQNYQPQYDQQSKDPNTAYLIELVGGLFGFLGLGYFYIGRTGEGITRLIIWLLYAVFAWITISVLLTVFIGVVCLPIQFVIQIAIPIWSASSLKKQMVSFQ
jgi:TM2 domain-containing membrane protein YozV